METATPDLDSPTEERGVDHGNDHVRVVQYPLSHDALG